MPLRTLFLLPFLAAPALAQPALEALKHAAEAPASPQAGPVFDGAAPAPALRVGAAERTILSDDDFLPSGRSLLSEPFEARHKSGRYTLGDECADLNGNGRCDQMFFAGYQRLEDPKSSWWKWLLRGVRRDPGAYNTADGVADDLQAKAFVLEQGDVKIGLVVLDVVGLLHHDVEKIRDRVKDQGFDLVIVQATHNHAGPDTLGLWGPIYTHAIPAALAARLAGIDALRAVNGKNEYFMERLFDRAAEALRAADAGAAPATLHLGAADAPTHEGKGLAVDVRDPQVLDERIRVLQARGEDGRTLATLANYAIHPAALGTGIDRMSADLSGALARALAAGGGVGIHSNGAIGAQIEPNLMFGETTEERRRAADLIGALAGRKALDAVTEALPEPVARIGFARRELFIPLDNKLLESVSRRGALDRPMYTAGVEAKDGQDLKTEIDLIVLHAADGRPLAEIFTVPGELAPEIYLGGYLPQERAPNPQAPPLPVLKEHLRSEHQFLLGLGNDELGYFVPMNDFRFPGDFLKILPAKDRFGRRHYDETVAASSQMPAIVAWNLIGMLEAYYDGKTEWTPQAVQVRARREALAALAGQSNALPALVRLLAHEPMDEVTPLARRKLLEWAPAGLDYELSKAVRRAKTPELRRLLSETLREIERKSP